MTLADQDETPRPQKSTRFGETGTQPQQEDRTSIKEEQLEAESPRSPQPDAKTKRRTSTDTSQPQKGTATTDNNLATYRAPRVLSVCSNVVST